MLRNPFNFPKECWVPIMRRLKLSACELAHLATWSRKFRDVVFSDFVWESRFDKTLEHISDCYFLNLTPEQQDLLRPLMLSNLETLRSNRDFPCWKKYFELLSRMNVWRCLYRLDGVKELTHYGELHPWKDTKPFCRCQPFHEHAGMFRVPMIDYDSKHMSYVLKKKSTLFPIITMHHNTIVDTHPMHLLENFDRKVDILTATLEQVLVTYRNVSDPNAKIKC